MIESQMRLATAWLDMATQGFRIVADAQAAALKQGAQIMSEATRAFAPPQPVFPFATAFLPQFPAFPGFQASSPPTLWPFSATPATSPWMPWTMNQPAANPFAFNPWSQTMNPAAWFSPAAWFQPPALFPTSTPASRLLDSAAAAYRTAGGHATAVVLTALNPPKTTQSLFWSWPVPRVLHAPTI